MMDTNPLILDINAEELDIFLEDVNDCLHTLETGILQLEQQHDAETLNAIFRAAHTLKALAGIVGHQSLAEVTHKLETIFESMRQGTLIPTSAVADELLAVVDVLKILRDEIIERQSSGINIDDIISRLNAFIQNEQVSPAIAAGRDQPVLTAEQHATLAATEEPVFEIRLKTHPGTFAPAARLHQAMLALLEVGYIIAQQPPAEALEGHDEQIWLLIATELEAEALQHLLQELEYLAKIEIQPYITTNQPLADLASPAGITAANPGNIKSEPDNNPDKTVRIDVERLDTLLNLVGELVTSRTRLMQIEEMLQVRLGKSHETNALTDLTSHFNHIVNQLQEEVMRTRMLPIASLFNKFPRLVRNVARPTGKQVNLIIKGEATELDRAVIQAIGDPLLHLLRNAVGHGLELPDERQAAGKSPTGTIRLSAGAQEGQIIVTVADDGRGIHPAQVKQAALRAELISEEEIAQLNTDEVIDLIFQPRLSTAVQITEVSGRGVGLDVVRSNIEQLGGSVVVFSQVGQGTTFRLTLPLTLALVQTMLVTARDNTYAIPVVSILASLYLAEADIQSVKGNPAFMWQEEVIPLLDLREFFKGSQLPFAAQNGHKPGVVLVMWGKLKIGLIVDKILGQQEIVVKSLSPVIGQVAGLSGATILGDGRIAFIIDIPNLINNALRSRRQEIV